MKKQELKQKGRRKFLRSSAAAGAGAAIVASTPASAIALTETEQAEKESKGYRVTEHVSAYYKTAAE
ncbi:MAG: formate dehydrogenase [Arenicellales bacterium]